MTKKLRVGVVFGGRSGEHEISLRSARSIIEAIDKNKYEVVPIGITREGRWLVSSAATLPEEVMQSRHSVALISDPTNQALVHLSNEGILETERLDVVFPVLHGTYGEDGTIQGLLEMADIAYVGCGVLASSVGMDKVMMKKVFEAHGLPVGPYTYFLRIDWEKNSESVLQRLQQNLSFPMFVKPANLGSSVGISKAKNPEQLRDAITLACLYDRKIIVEQGINAREFELSVLGNDEPIVSLPGEVIPGAEFYDYNDKYIDNKTQFEIPAKLTEDLVAQMQQLSIRAFQAIDGSGLSRVDLFMDRDTNRLYLNEINTLPGFTSISMYPKLWQTSGISYAELIERLIQLAIERKADRSRNITTI